MGRALGLCGRRLVLIRPLSASSKHLSCCEARDVYHQEVLTIAPSGGITELFLWGMREGRRRVG